VVEERLGVPELGESGGAVALFESDKTPVDDGFMGEVLGLMALSREELIGIVGGLGEGTLDAVLVPGKRSARRDITHVVDAEEWYVSQLGRRHQEIYEEGLRGEVGQGRLGTVERLRITRPYMVAALEAALAEDRQGPFVRKAHVKYPEEEWTLRKVLRRFLEHEREHVWTIEKTLGELHA